MARDRDEFDFEIEDNEARMTTGRGSLELPPGLGLWSAKKPGTYRVEFLPYAVTENHDRFVPELRRSRPGRWYKERTYYVHGGVGVDNAMVTCPLKTFGKPCPICREREKLQNSPYKEDKDRFFALKPRERQLWLVVPRDERTGELDADVKLWDISQFCFGKQLREFIAAADREDRDAYEQFYHPSRGFTVKMNATEEPMGTGGSKFLKFSVIEFRDRKTPVPRDLWEHGYDLDAIPKLVEADALSRLFHGVEDGDADEAPARGRPARDERPDRDEPRGRREPEPDPEPPRRRRPEPEPEPEPAGRGGEPEVVFGVLDRVTWRDKSGLVEGVVKKTDPVKRILMVEVEGREKLVPVAYEAAVQLEIDATFDAKPADKKPEPPAGKDRAPRAGSPRGRPDPKDAWDDGDDAGGGPDEPPPPKKRGK